MLKLKSSLMTFSLVLHISLNFLSFLVSLIKEQTCCPGSNVLGKGLLPINIPPSNCTKERILASYKANKL